MLTLTSILTRSVRAVATVGGLAVVADVQCGHSSNGLYGAI